MLDKKMQKSFKDNPELAYEMDLLAKRVKNELGIQTPMTEFEEKKADKAYEQIIKEADRMIEENKIDPFEKRRKNREKRKIPKD